MKLLLKNGRLIEPAKGKDFVTDVFIVDGIIEKIKPNLSVGKGIRIIELDGKIISPGFTDMHVHLREPGFEYKETIESGCRAAAAGGFTAICCMPNTNPTIDDASVVKYIYDRSMLVCDGIVEVYPVAAITKNRLGVELSPLIELADAGAVAFSDDGAPVEDAEVMRRALEYASMIHRPIIQHAEEVSLSRAGVMNEGVVSTALGMQPIPPIAESIMIQRDIQLVEYIGAEYHIAHISTGNSLNYVRSAKEKNLPVSCEVTPHHFSLNEETVRSFDTNTKMNPPLRTIEDVMALKEGLRDGTIDVIATDHAPHSFDEKQVEYLYAPFGIVGLETAIGLSIKELVIPKLLSIEQLIEKFSINPRRILHLPPIIIGEGERANFTLIDPFVEWTVDVHRFKSKSKNSPFQGWKLRGRAIGVINNSCIFLSE